MWMSSAQQLESGVPSEVDPEIIKLMAHRYGDGLVYLRGQEERDVYEQAKKLGLISREGYLTPVGRSVMVNYGQ